MLFSGRLHAKKGVAPCGSLERLGRKRAGKGLVVGGRDRKSRCMAFSRYGFGRDLDPLPSLWGPFACEKEGCLAAASAFVLAVALLARDLQLAALRRLAWQLRSVQHAWQS